MGIMILFGLIIAGGVLRVILGIASMIGDTYVPPEPRQDVHVDVHVTQDPPQPQYPTIAEQLDGRLTNIVKDPMQGIL